MLIFCLTNYFYRYDKICDIYLKFKKENPQKIAKPLDMSKLVFNFITAREKQLRNKNIIDTTRYKNLFIINDTSHIPSIYVLFIFQQADK